MAEYRSGSAGDTAALGAALARAVTAPCVIALEGPLGAGKTTFVRGFLRACGHQGPVRSPTYTLVETYPLDDGPLHHLDLYRLADPEELEYLGVRDLAAGDALWLIEWPERGRGFLPPFDRHIAIDCETDGCRRIRGLPAGLKVSDLS